MVVLQPRWHPALVVLSWVVSFLGATTTSLLLCQSHAAKKLQTKLLWIFVASLVFGFSSIWSLHFIATISQILPVPVTYNTTLTILSAVIAVLTVSHKVRKLWLRIKTFLAFAANLLTKYFRRRFKLRRPKPFRVTSDDHRILLAKHTSNPNSEESGLLAHDFAHDENHQPARQAPLTTSNPTSALPSVVDEGEEEISDDEAAADKSRHADPESQPSPGERHPLANGFFGPNRPDLPRRQSESQSSRRSSLAGQSESLTDTTLSDTDPAESSEQSTGFSLGVTHAFRKSLKKRPKSLVEELKASLKYAVTNKIVLARSALWAIAICGMHYCGIAAQQVADGYITFSPILVIASYLVAFIVCLAASVYIRELETRPSRQLFFSLLASTGVFSMHFVGTTATTFHSSHPQDWNRTNVPIVLVFGIIGLSILTCTVSCLLLSQVTTTSRNRILEVVIAKRRLWRIMAQKEAAEAANALKSDFISVASHEIRTPLHTVSGYSELLARTELTDEQVLYLTNIRRAVHSIQLITRQVLDFSRMERDAGETEAKPSEIDLREVVGGLADFSEDRPTESNSVALMVFISEAVPKLVYIDETYLTRILMNLVSNALKFTQSGHVLLSIDLVDGQLHASVEDTGIGISPKFQKSLFDPFSQADQSLTRKHTGTGLGLAISRQLTKRLGSELEVHSKEKEGTTFSLSIPMPNLASSEPLSVSKECHRANFLIAVCEEHPKTRQRMLELWRRLGFKAQPWLAAAESLVDDLCDADFVWISSEWAQKHLDLLPSILRQGPRNESDELPRPIVCFSHSSIEDFAISPLLRTSSNILNFKRPLIFHTAALALDDPAAHLALPSQPERVKLVRFASNASRSTDGSPAAEVQIERNAFADAMAQRQAQQTMLEALPVAKTSSSDSSPTALKLVLLVEDNAINSRLGSRILQKLGYESHLASNGQEAVDWLNLTREIPSAILMDCGMPVMNGFEATKCIRAMEAEGRIPHIPIIALTANVTSESELSCLKAGMDAFLPKPLLIADLSVKLKKYIT